MSTVVDKTFAARWFFPPTHTWLVSRRWWDSVPCGCLMEIDLGACLKDSLQRCVTYTLAHFSVCENTLAPQPMWTLQQAGEQRSRISVREVKPTGTGTQWRESLWCWEISSFFLSAVGEATGKSTNYEAGTLSSNNLTEGFQCRGFYRVRNIQYDLKWIWSYRQQLSSLAQQKGNRWESGPVTKPSSHHPKAHSCWILLISACLHVEG